MYGGYYMFTKCLWGGQEVLDIRDIIESGKYEIKGLSFQYSSSETSASVTVNQSGYLLYFYLRSDYNDNYYVGYDINTQLVINTGIASNTIISTNIAKTCTYKFSNLDKEDFIYSFDVENKTQNYNVNMKRVAYTFPSNKNGNYYTINTNASVNVNTMLNNPNNATRQYYNYISYYPIRFNKLVATISYTSNSQNVANFEGQAGVLVYAIPK